MTSKRHFEIKWPLAVWGSDSMKRNYEDLTFISFHCSIKLFYWWRKVFANFQPPVSNYKSFSPSIEQFFLTESCKQNIILAVDKNLRSPARGPKLKNTITFSKFITQGSIFSSLNLLCSSCMYQREALRIWNESLCTMVIQVAPFSSGGYKIRKIFA